MMNKLGPKDPPDDDDDDDESSEEDGNEDAGETEDSLSPDKVR